MASNPGASIPQLFAHPYDTKAAYTFFAHPEVDPETLQLTHRSLVAERMGHSGTYLLVEDTTELDWTGRARIPGLGPIGNSTVGTQGVLRHTVLGVQWVEDAELPPHGRRPAVPVLGVCDQQSHLRVPRRVDEKRGNSWATKKRKRESQLWQWASERIGPAPEQARWVRVCDAAADIYEHLTPCLALGYGVVIRSGQDRAVGGSDGGSHGERLYETARSAPRLGSFTIELPARKGAPARVATLAVSAQPVQLRSPQRPGVSTGHLPPVPCTGVRVWEEQPAAAEEAWEWILLCDGPVQNFAQARTCALQYATRWVIEDYHKALKTGLGAERLRLETAARLFAAVALMSVVAVRLVGFREQVGCNPEQPAEAAGLTILELEVLRTVNIRPVRTVQEVALALGRLGGHLNRHPDGLPGWQTLWRGMKKLLLLVEGVRLAREMREFGEW
jgi:hypothetical protein